MTADETVLVLMASVHQTMKMEDELEKSKIAFRSVAKPRTLGTDCGIALKVPEHSVPEVKRIASSIDCTIAGIFINREKCWEPYPPGRSKGDE